MGKLSDTEIPADTGDFRVMSRRAVAALGQLREQHRFMKGLYAWIGFRQTAVLYRRDARASGTTKFNYRKLLRFAVDGITAFSTVPLKFATSIGLLVAVPAFGMAAFIVGKTLLYGDPVHGYPSMMTALLLLGGLQLVFLGVLGEYVGRLFNEVKRRPVYLVASYTAPIGPGTPPLSRGRWPQRHRVAPRLQQSFHARMPGRQSSWPPRGSSAGCHPHGNPCAKPIDSPPSMRSHDMASNYRDHDVFERKSLVFNLFRSSHPPTIDPVVTTDYLLQALADA
jgi:hypothetical protein